MSTCEITINNGIPSAKSFPRLMDQILSYTNFNIEQSLDLYGVVLDPEFQELNLKNPQLENILSFVEQDTIDKTGSLRKSDKELLLNLRLQENNTSDTVKQDFLDAFTVDGRFGIDMEKISKSGLFSRLDLVHLEETIPFVKELWYRLHNTTEEFSTIQSPFVVSTGGLSKQNPDQILKKIRDNYIGLTTETQILDKAERIGDQTVLDNPSLIPAILSEVSGKQKLVQYETDEYTDSVERKVSNDLRAQIEQSLDMEQNFESFSGQIQYIRELPQEIFEEYKPVLDTYLRNLEAQALEFGIDLRGFADTSQTKSYEDILVFLDSLYNFLYDTQQQNPQDVQESIVEFVQEHRNFFDTEAQGVNKIVPMIQDEGVYLYLETNRTEEEMFSKQGLIKIQDNIYRKINTDKTLGEVYDMIFKNPGLLPKEAYSVSVKESNRDLVLEDIDRYISEQSKRYLTQNSDIETIKKMSAFNILLSNSYRPGKKTWTGNLDLKVDQFLVDINKKILQDQDLQDIFYFSNRGLEAHDVLGEYTTQKIRDILPQATMQDLVKYAKISGNSSLEYLTSLDNESGVLNPRDFYANNIEQLEVYPGEYLEENGYIVANSNEEFLRIRNELYEEVAPNVYARIERDLRYLNSGLEKPYYDNSVEVTPKGQESGKITVKKNNEINSNEIEFC